MSSSLSLRLAPGAERDLKSILQYTLETWGESQHQIYSAMLHDAFEQLCRFPNLGRQRTDFGERIRSLSVGQHLILYRVYDESIEVARIVHSRMKDEIDD